MWSYLACTDSTSSRASEESLKPSKDMSSPSLTVKTTDTRKGSSYHEWLQETCRLRRYGMTLPRYGELTFQGSILSTEDSPAKIFPLPDAERAWAASAADYFSRSSGSRARYDPDSSSWRTSQSLLFEEQSELLASFAASGMTVGGAYYPLRMWARITGERDGGCWPTPTTNPEAPNKGSNKQSGPKSLAEAARYGQRLWRTPQAWNATQGPKSKELFEKCMETGQSAITLVDQVRMWPTPDTGMSPNGHGRRGGKIFNGRQSGASLDAMAKSGMWPTPTICAGQNPGDHGTGGPNLASVAGGQLNPTWVEWLMGYPCGWTVLEAWVIPWFRPKRGKLLKDLSALETDASERLMGLKQEAA